MKPNDLEEATSELSSPGSMGPLLLLLPPPSLARLLLLPPRKKEASMPTVELLPV